ncbi:hypothetical protein PoB_006280300 [Plakobranchus ocellatus]|uniref:Peptidase M12B propeptide domain-containing protein n=1 Tax=Plakobranchus ocellatus TaxID=259542 RepID=A0AAV4CWQ0_9GAST|nr:hypothetical protein PoB_006280300 [Plakobranchus ocellatus]
MKKHETQRLPQARRKIMMITMIVTLSQCYWESPSWGEKTTTSHYLHYYDNAPIGLYHSKIKHQGGSIYFSKTLFLQVTITAGTAGGNIKSALSSSLTQCSNGKIKHQGGSIYFFKTLFLQVRSPIQLVQLEETSKVPFLHH